MQIMTRKEAKSLGLKTYATGKPCINGHVAYRYTQSGSCSSCVVAANSVTTHDTPQRVERNESIAAAHTARVEALSALVTVKLFVHPSDVEILRDTVVAVGLARFPALKAHDFRPLHAKAAGTVTIYEFQCAAEDVEFLRGVQNALHEPYRVTESPYGAILGKVEAKYGPLPCGEIVPE